MHCHSPEGDTQVRAAFESSSSSDAAAAAAPSAASLLLDYIYTTNDRISVRCSANARTPSITAAVSALSLSLMGMSHHHMASTIGHVDGRKYNAKRQTK